MQMIDEIDLAFEGETVRFVVRGWPNVSSGGPAIVTPGSRWECEYRGRTLVLFDVNLAPTDTPALRAQLIEALLTKLG